MIRDVLDDLKDELQTSLQAKLVAQDEKFDEKKHFVSTESIDVYIGDRGLPNIQNLPAIILAPLDSGILQEAITTKKDFLHTIAAVVLVSEPDPESGQKKCWTILRAFENVMEAKINFNSVSQYQTQSISYSEIGAVQLNKDETVWTSALQFTVRERVDSYTTTQL